MEGSTLITGQDLLRELEALSDKMLPAQFEAGGMEQLGLTDESIGTLIAEIPPLVAMQFTAAPFPVTLSVGVILGVRAANHNTSEVPE